MAGKKPTAPSQVYVALSGIYHGDATIQGVYSDGDAAEMASNNNHELVHVIPVNYNGVDGATNGNADGEVTAKAKPKAKSTKAEKDSTGETATRVSKKKSVPDGEPGSLVGLNIATTGTLRTMDRETFKQAVEKFGGTFTENFANANSIVLGEKAGPKKVEEINDNGYGTISEEHFYGMIGSVFAPPAKRAKKE